MNWIAALTLLAGMLALNHGRAQERKQPAADAPPRRTTVYALRNADPGAVVQVLAGHFQGQAEVSALNSALVVSASPAVSDELTRLLAQIDRKPRTVMVEVVLAEVATRKGPDGKEVEVDVTGDAAGKLEALARSGQAALQRVSLTALEGQPVTSTTGGSRPVTTGSTVTATGLAQRSVSYQPVGTTVVLTARVGADGAVALDLNLTDKKVRPAEAGAEVTAPATENATLATHLSVPAGQAVVAQSVRTDGKAGGTLAVVVVTARAVEPGTAKTSNNRPRRNAHRHRSSRNRMARTWRPDPSTETSSVRSAGGVRL
jgi:hypothetical protein